MSTTRRAPLRAQHRRDGKKLLRPPRQIDGVRMGLDDREAIGARDRRRPVVVRWSRRRPFPPLPRAERRMQDRDGEKRDRPRPVQTARQSEIGDDEGEDFGVGGVARKVSSRRRWPAPPP